MEPTPCTPGAILLEGLSRVPYAPGRPEVARAGSRAPTPGRVAHFEFAENMADGGM